jgi:hypothetical protein
MPNGAQSASILSNGYCDMTETEWQEYCQIIHKEIHVEAQEKSRHIQIGDTSYPVGPRGRD